MTRRSARFVRFLTPIGALLAVGAALLASREQETGVPSQLRISNRAIELPAVVTSGSFEREIMGMPGYHLIVWKDGHADMASLFRAEVTDVQVIAALEHLEAKPGNALGMARSAMPGTRCGIREGDDPVPGETGGVADGWDAGGSGVQVERLPLALEERGKGIPGGRPSL